MIIARLKIQTDPDGSTYFSGVTVSSWPLAIGTRVVLTPRGGEGEFELLELADRRRPKTSSAKSIY